MLPGRLTSSLRRRLRQARSKLRPEVLYTYTLRGGRGPVGEAWPGYSLVEVSEENLAEFQRAHPTEQTARKHGIMTGRINHPVESSWLIRGPSGEWCGYCHLAWAEVPNARIGHRVKVGPGQAYFFDDYVVRAARGRGLQAFSIASRLEIAARRGVAEGLTTISRGNAPSRASYAKFGLQRTGVLLAYPRWKRTIAIPTPRRLSRT